jgi:16S rRNA (uracil1498-N3)-methyltransferase
MESLRTSSAHVLVTSDQLSATGAVVLDSDTEHHLRRVLRLRDGEAVSVTDGAGRWLLTRASIAGPVIRLEPTSKLVTEPARARPITIAVAMPKGDRLDWLVQKVTELGVDRIALLHAERSVVRWKPERTATQLERLRRISDEACRQSRRVWRVTIDEPLEATAVLASFIAAEPGGRDLAPGDRSVAIGPEGGWSADELDQAAELVSLGKNILRTETAAVAASTLCVTFER